MTRESMIHLLLNKELIEIVEKAKQFFFLKKNSI